MQGKLDLAAARDLEPGNLIRLTDSRFERVQSVAFEDGHLIVGGPEKKTAIALRIVTEGGVSLLVHPGQMVGVKKP